ncbi:hypothetical protein H257_14509 [Aphanomyces astaci]|uniref:Macro domain-containing protein n=1 Tax=Aphanomyces astaci TaxID=112090 RepID=W4FQY4_APHAT|nr:hypothetical protein H257_14509 [Aphanomyces astaci]ETV69910.1 hypothetical protein H257_14509 [Aphanomyces astaci]|eukprot:XP_009840648.1 hypothetical protein H257_14509 [Aphanomyces astaci]
MLYPAQTIDGLVSLAGGRQELQKLLANIDGAIKCPTGSAVFTKAPVHTATPFYLAHDWESKLVSYYNQSLYVTTASGPFSMIAVSLLGSGCKGIPVADAVRLACIACRAWDADATPSIPSLHVIFGIQDPSIETQFQAEFARNQRNKPAVQ